MCGCRQVVRSALMLLCGVLLMGGAGSARAASENIAVVLDPGGDQRENRQLAERMKNDLKNVLERRGGYKVRLLGAADEFKQGQGEYLLDVRIVRYRSGSKAARLVVGFGAGAASLDIHYEFTDPQGRKMVSKDDGVGTSLDWQRLARKLNENMLAAIQQSLASGEAAAVEPAVPAKAAPAATQAAKPAASAEPSEQLKKLETLKKDGLITDSEYQQKRKDILDRL